MGLVKNLVSSLLSSNISRTQSRISFSNPYTLCTREILTIPLYFRKLPPVFPNMRGLSLLYSLAFSLFSSGDFFFFFDRWFDFSSALSLASWVLENLHLSFHSVCRLGVLLQCIQGRSGVAQGILISFLKSDTAFVGHCFALREDLMYTQRKSIKGASSVTTSKAACFRSMIRK